LPIRESRIANGPFYLCFSIFIFCKSAIFCKNRYGTPEGCPKFCPFLVDSAK
jgi:hypothetical protein